jgi:hypothetical protein
MNHTDPTIAYDVIRCRCRPGLVTGAADVSVSHAIARRLAQGASCSAPPTPDHDHPGEPTPAARKPWPRGSPKP